MSDIDGIYNVLFLSYLIYMLSEIIANAKSKNKKKGNALLPNTLFNKN